MCGVPVALAPPVPRAKPAGGRCSERFADGRASKKELGAANYWAESPTFGYDFCDQWRRFAPDDRTPPEIEHLVALGVLSTPDLMPIDTPEVDELVIQVREAAELVFKLTQQDACWLLRWYGAPKQFGRIRWSGAWLLRCIFENPFRPVLLDPSWLTSTVVALAQGIYEERAFERMPILADALQDAGCDNADILDHCRGGGTHVRGCWVVDLVLGKE
jgi:hypothetical protein